MTWRLMPILLAGFVVGCSDPAPAPIPAAQAALASAAAAQPQACDLMTADDVKSLIGEPVGPGEQTGFECAYRRPPNEKDLRTTAVQVRLEISQGTPQQLVDRFANVMRQGLGGSYELSTEPGLGDVGVWDGDAMIASRALTPLRSAFVVVQLSGVDASGERLMARHVADRALSRVKR
jgi:hypothetical protein